MSKSRLLVVDDSESIRFAVRTFFEDDGHEVEDADSLKRALELCATRRFDAAIVDYKLPDGTALDLLAQLKEGG
ncbi:MAG: response regulator, partial [Deltaproteobacteria bacterium]|nr:response regulator [Deltaproteobacteria bacterium]